MHKAVVSPRYTNHRSLCISGWNRGSWEIGPKCVWFWKCSTLWKEESAEPASLSCVKESNHTFFYPSTTSPKLDYISAGNDRNIYNGNVTNLLNAPFWQQNSQGLMQMVLNQSNYQTSHSKSDLLEACAALFASNGAMNLKHKIIWSCWSTFFRSASTR